MFVAAVFTIAKTWGKKCVYQQMSGYKPCGIFENGVLFSHKKEGNPAIGDNMDGP